MKHIIYRGEPFEFKYKRLRTLPVYLFYIGEYRMGQVCKTGKRRWSATSVNPGRLDKVDGFGSRYAASVYLLKFNGYI